MTDTNHRPATRPTTGPDYVVDVDALRARLSPGGDLWERNWERHRIRQQIRDELDRQTLERLLRDRDTPPASRWRRVLDALFH